MPMSLTEGWVFVFLDPHSDPSVLQVLWPRSRITVFGSFITGLALPTSDIDLLVGLPPVRSLVSMLPSLKICSSEPGLPIVRTESSRLGFAY